ncbi:hypothetical protein [Prosthecobacter dejongeii]|uniref:SMODS and SLOG-associating 2TM effector domain-containing protein n=1 Tax=Prosthecobacter dejongeii TaxID=48465 RepID=A0A7W8DPL7_9BACT|nr:hypothetical protein [Prosthecobacter dejongeii]MBB5037578.1 hypothetical protein [Prosthecobacter dejongeii]
MLKPCYLIGFTGHRAGYDEATVRASIQEVLGELRERAQAQQGEVELYTSLAEGADTLCVEIARELGMAVHLLLPLSAEEFAKDFSSPEAWARSQRQLDTALQLPGWDSVHEVPGERTRPECYFNQAIHMLDAVDVMVAVWDGQPARGLGGTEQVVSQAKAMGKPVILIDPKTGKTQMIERNVSIFPADAVLMELNALAAETGVPASQSVSTPRELQACMDEIAMKEAGRFRPSLVLIIFLHACAALLAALVTFRGSGEAVWDETKWTLTLLELGLVSFALWMSFRLRRKHIQQRWIRCRFACELVRGLRTSIPILNPLHPAITRHDPQWTRFVLSAGLLVLRHQDTADVQVLKDRYVDIRLGDQHEDGQIRHYLKMRPTALRWWDFTGHVSRWSAMLAPAFVVLSLFNKLSKHWWPPEGLQMEKYFWLWLAVVFFPIALPMLAGVASSLRNVLDAGRRKDRYPQMAARLTEIRTALVGMKTKSTIETQVARSEELLLDELLEWKQAIKNAGR